MPLKPSTAACAALGLMATLLLGGCATPIDIGGADSTLTPRQAATDTPVPQRTVAWGGAIVAARNLREHTEIEVLAYPLDYRHQPNIAAKPTGRFIAIHPGYLETVDYAPGRLITLVGFVTGTRDGEVGEARYVYPLVAIGRLYLWPRTAAASEPQVHIGIGVGISR